MIDWGKDIIHLDGFGGCAGFWHGLKKSGINITTHYYSEIDKAAIAVAHYQDKNLINVGSITNVVKSGIKRPDIFTFGSPCQGFSGAGKNEGLGHSGSVLIKEAIKVIAHFKPPVFIWENVKGVITSTHREDFWAVIQAFANIGGYRLEWQLLNTDWFLPQNRERIYLVGHLAGASEPKVFPIRENDFLANSPQQEEASRRGWVQIHPNRNASAINKRLAKMGVADNYIKISSGTSTGYELAQHGDGIRLDHLTNLTNGKNTGRGRVQKGKAQTLDTQSKHGVLLQEKIRRLTEVECERLQGFPDDWTKYGIVKGQVKETSATQRYSMMGNAISIPLVEMIGEKLQAR